jgi:hypothetical protein
MEEDEDGREAKQLVEPSRGPPAAASSVEAENKHTDASSAGSLAAAKSKSKRKKSVVKSVSRRRLVFCIAENPQNQHRSSESRIEVWSVLSKMKSVAVVCSSNEFREWFQCFLMPEEEVLSSSLVSTDEGPFTAASSLSSAAGVAKDVVAAGARELTRSQSVAVLSTMFPLFEQPSSPQMTASLPPRKNDAAGLISKCWDAAHVVWCPVMRLRKLESHASSVSAAVVFAVEPLTRPLREDASYVCRLPLLQELQDRYAAETQNVMDEHVRQMQVIHGEIAMLQQELKWASDRLDDGKCRAEANMRKLEDELSDLHLRLAVATGGRRGGACGIRKHHLSDVSPCAAMTGNLAVSDASSPIRKFSWGRGASVLTNSEDNPTVISLDGIVNAKNLAASARSPWTGKGGQGISSAIDLCPEELSRGDPYPNGDPLPKEDFVCGVRPQRHATVAGGGLVIEGYGASNRRLL